MAVVRISDGTLNVDASSGGPLSAHFHMSENVTAECFGFITHEKEPRVTIDLDDNVSKSNVKIFARREDLKKLAMAIEAAERFYKENE